MEILNRNRRNRAFWRIAIVAVLAWGAVIAAVYNTHVQYRDQGKDELARQKAMFETRINELESQLGDQRSATTKAEVTIEELREAANAAPDEAQRLAQEREKAKDDEIERLDRRNKELERAVNACESKLSAQNNF